MLKPFAVVIAAGFAWAASAAQIEFDFSKDALDQSPPGFASLVTGPGLPGPWKIVREPVPPLLAPLESDAPVNTTERFVLGVQSFNLAPNHNPVLLFTNEIFNDFTFTSRFKISGGIIEPSAGLVFRAQDQSNYYVVRASTEGNLLWYKVVNGQSYESLGIGVLLPIARDTWRELRIECQGSRFRCYLDGRLAIPPARPGSPTNDLAINDTTFARGKVGFWTKADSKCRFVDARVQYAPQVPYVQVVIHNVIKKFPSLLGLRVYALKNGGPPVVIGDMNEKGLGEAGTKVEQNVIENAAIYYMNVRKERAVEITLALRDRNGDIAGALKIRMKSFRGETQSTAVTRAVLIKKYFEQQIETQDING
jgi:hypothetical protein